MRGVEAIRTGGIRFLKGIGGPPPAAKSSFYLEDLDSTDLERIRGLCGQGRVEMTELPRLNGAVVTLKPEEKEAFLSSIRAYPKKINVVQGKKIAFQSFMSKGIFQSSRAKSTPPVEDHTLDILDMRKVHNGPLGQFTGKGETICVIDSGIYPAHPDFQDSNGKSRLKGFVDFVEGKEGLKYANDRWGHGTHMCGDAAGNGKASGGLFERLAPEADLVALKVEEDTDVLKAIDWVLANHEKYGITVVSLSIGLTATGSYKTDPMARAVGKLIDHGIYVTAAAGNSLGDERINTPGIHPDVVTATALDTHHGKDFKKFTISPAASGGPDPFDPEVDKPNLALPGVDIYGPLAPMSLVDPKESALTPFGKYYPLSGTSTPCQMAAGMIACLHQALREKGLSLTPHEMLKVLEQTARPLYDQETGKPVSHFRQGAGVPDGFDALRLALLQGHR